MFNRRVAVFIILWGLASVLLWWFWQEPKGVSVSSAAPMVSSERWRLDLSGSWQEYSSLRQAWTTASQPEDRIRVARLDSRELVLPSTSQFQVATRHFRIPGEWSGRTMRLVLNGVDGHARVYLNGVDSGHLVGEFEGQGGTYALELPPSAFLYGQDNILLIELTSSQAQEDSVLGLSWPEKGRISGQIYLEAVAGTTIDNLQIAVAWVGDDAKLELTADLQHRFWEKGPWTVDIVLSDGSAEVAQSTQLVKKPDDSSNSQSFTAEIHVPEARRWSMDDPYLYHLHITVSNEQGARDDLAVAVGLRSLEFTPEGWSLNGQPFKVNGVAVSEVTESQLRHEGNVKSWLLDQKEQGINLVYFIGRYPDEIWLQTADQVGIGIWVEWPLQVVPGPRLPDPQQYEELVASGQRHPSVWSWTVGKGVDLAGTDGVNYLNSAGELVNPAPGFALQLPYNAKTRMEQNTLWPGLGAIKQDWGQITLYQDEKAPVIAEWANEEKAAGIWTVLLAVVMIMNVRSGSWGYKDIGEKRPKRRLRSAWFWNGAALVMREGTLAGLITSALFQAPAGWGAWFGDVWPWLTVLQQQDPWLIWLVGTFSLVLIRLLQLGLAAARMPGSPHPLGLAYWLERRYRWVVLVGLLWALRPWGVPSYAALAGYVILTLAFLPWRIRDVHHVRGRYRSYLIVPGVILGVFIGRLLLDWPDLLYIWHLISTN